MFQATTRSLARPRFFVASLIPEIDVMTAGARQDSLEPLLQAAVSRGLDYGELYRAILAGKLQAEQRGSRWWVAPAELDRFATERVKPKRGRPRAAR